MAPRAFQHPGAPGFPFPNGSGVVAAPAINNLNGFGGFNRGFNNSFNNGFQGSGKGGRGNRNNNTFFYPIFVGGGYYGGYGTGSYDPAPFAPELMGPQAFAPAPMPAPGPAQAGPTVVYPSQQQPEGGRTIIELRPDGTYATLRQGAVPAGMPPAYGGDVASQDAQDTSGDAPHFMIAFKDHTVYSAVAYWFEGDILHYFTNGNTHNQASVSLIDRPLTERLNREMGIPFRMPAEK